ncbi:MAG: selenide, water dikinase SelD [Promethearchaeota archaeon]
MGSNKLETLLKNVGLKGDIEDAAIVAIPNSEIVQVKNLDVFTPIVDEPEIMGQIAACNVTNDIFALNVPEITGMLIFLAINKNTPMEIAEGILHGIKYFMEEKINSKVVGGHTIYSEWPLIGGEASGFVNKNKIIRKHGVKDGDKLILTKPIGLQPIMAAYRILKDIPEMLETYSEKQLRKSIKLAINIMTISNQNVVKTIHSYDDYSFIHAMTDVTGFGLAGHLSEMLQNSNLSALIETVPSIKFSETLSAELGYAFDECKCSETAGGMLIAIDPYKVEDFSKNLSRNGIPNWNVGTIDTLTPGLVRISENVKSIEITKY